MTKHKKSRALNQRRKLERFGEKHKDCEEGKEKRGEEEEGTKDIDSTSDMDELSTDYTSEGSDEFQDCDGEEFEDWTSEADCGHQLMRSFPSHCIGRRIEIRQSKRDRDEQSELEESVVHEHHESGNCAYKDEQTYCSRSIAREHVELRAELVQQHLQNKRKEPSDKDGKPSKAAKVPKAATKKKAEPKPKQADTATKAKSATNKLPTKASTEARDPITLEKCSVYTCRRARTGA